VELDALPAEILEARIIREVEAGMNMKALSKVKRTEARDLKKLSAVFVNI
jgi:hypothetical protein